ncbi:MAG: rod shape-determining protein MreD [Methylotenera sp.]|nr:rod shape-determining protein MreD [Methylotenera sp.]
MPVNKLKTMYFSVLLAFMSLLLPWSQAALVVRPDFMLLVLIFWLIRAPNLCNVGAAWMLGLLVDLAAGMVFGQYALAYTVTAFLAVTYQRRLVLFTGMQQLLYVFSLLMVAQLMLLIIKTFAGWQFSGWSYFLPSLSGVLLWWLAMGLGLNTGGRGRAN